MSAILEGNHVISGLDRGDALTHRLDYTRALVSEDNREGPLGVLSGEGVGICPGVSWVMGQRGQRDSTCVTDTGVVYLDANLVGLGRGDFDVLDGEGLGSTPGDGGLFGRSSAGDPRMVQEAYLLCK